MGGFWYGGAIKPCPGDGCKNQIPFTMLLCPDCAKLTEIEEQVDEAMVLAWGRREVERLEALLRFEAWCFEHHRP